MVKRFGWFVFGLLFSVGVVAQGGGRQYNSYKGLVMAGYQGWFNAPDDGSGRGWHHYNGPDGFRPGSCSVDFWPEVSEYKKLYKTEFTFADGKPAYVFSSHDESTVDVHFRWMQEYGLDGVFMQRFITEIRNESGLRHFNKVLNSAMKAANKYERAICVMYDLSGMHPGEEKLLLKDIAEVATRYSLKDHEKNPSYLYHNGKPLVTVWGVGFNDNRRYGIKEAAYIIDGLKSQGFSIMLGVPTRWRELNGDTQSDPRLHELIRKCDIVMPWFVGRYNETTYPQYQKLVEEDIQWAKKNRVDYAPLVFPGFSWGNMKGKDHNSFIPRNKGSFLWTQLMGAIRAGAEMIYVAMFDEIDEGTAIFKCAKKVPVGKSTFVPIEEGVESDHYLKLVGEAAKILRKERCSGETASVNAENAVLAPDRNINIVTNPMNLNYRFQPKEKSRREAADPVLEYFKGYYYLFASKSGGYWRSEDLADWEYIPCTTIPTLEDYAPTILAIGDTLYFTASSSKTQIFKNAHPEKDTWEPVDTKLAYQLHDPAFYRDDDGKVYMYWGCSDKDPIRGVEVDPKDGFRAVGEARVLIEHHGDKYGWEVPGKNNEERRQGWNEGPCMLKYEGRYYLQYAAPGTQYRIYGDGIYVGDNPLGPFEYMEDNPFSFKPGGFIGGAGHGHTFQDKYGNYWHVASMRISVRHSFERRLGLFPVAISTRNGMYAHTVWSDYPFYIPDRKVDFNKTDLSMGWNLLSFQKPVSASSSLAGHEPDRANDEKIETWWAAQTGKKGEWLRIDMETPMTVHAIHVNFADHDFKVFAPHPPVIYQFIIEGSVDGKEWMKLVDERENKKDEPHRLFTLDKPAKLRYLRISNSKDMEGCFSLSGFRMFGKGEGTVPSEVTGFRAMRDKNDRRIYRFTWDAQAGAIGYILQWGTQKDKLTHAVTIYDNQYEARYFNRDSEYYFSIKAFNENGY